MSSNQQTESVRDKNSESEAVAKPRPPKMDVSEGMYALGVWERGQTLYQFVENPLDPTDHGWEEMKHFEHGDKEVQSIHFDSTTAKPHLDENNQLVAVWLYTKSLSGGQSHSKNNQEDTNRNPREVGEDDEKRSLGDIGRDTSHHKVLTVVDQLTEGPDGAVSAKNIIKQSSVAEGTVYAAMTDLWERKLVERREEERDGKQDLKVYWLSPYGRQVLADIGEPSMQ